MTIVDLLFLFVPMFAVIFLSLINYLSQSKAEQKPASTRSNRRKRA